MKKTDYDKETTAKVEATVESYLKNNYEDIKSVEIEKIYTGPMGEMTVNGTVNGKYGFSIGIEESDFSIDSIGEKDGFPEIKEECKEKDCPY